MIIVRYNTTTPLIIGPVIKSTDGYSKLTGMTSAELQFDFWIGTGPTTGSYTTAECSGITEIGSGYYKTFFGSTMIQTVGMGKIAYVIGGSSGIPFWDDYMVIGANPYDSLIKGTGTDLLQVDISQVAGSTVNSTKPWHQTSAQGFLADINYIRGGTFSTRTADNIEAVFYNAGATAPNIYNELSTFTTENAVNVSRFAGGTFSTRSADNIEAFFYASGSTVGITVDEVVGTGDIITTNDGINIGAIMGAAVTTAGGDNFATWFDNAGAGVGKDIGDVSTFTTDNIVEANIVAMASQAITTDAADNWDNFWFNNDVVSTERVGDLVTTADITTFTTAKTVEANIVSMASQAITTDAADNWDNFWFNNDVVSTERVGDLVTTADITTFTTAKVVEANVVSMASQAITTDAADNWDNFWFNNDVVSTERVSDLPTTEDMISTNTVYDVWTHGDLMKLMQAHLLGNTTYDGDTYVLYDHGGTTFVKYEITTAERTRTT